jgi:hypothetical protein
LKIVNILARNIAFKLKNDEYDEELGNLFHHCSSSIN